MLSSKKIMIFIVAILLILAGGFLVGTKFQNWLDSDSEPVITSDLIAGELTEISELASLEYRYTDVGKFEDQGDFYGWKVPFATKSFLITYDGVMKLGIRGEDVNVETEGNRIIVTIPQAEILSHEIKEDSIKVYDQTKNIFNQILIEDYADFASNQKKEIEKKAVEEGFLEEAEKKAEKQILLFITSIVGTEGEYEITVK
ncbi:hypothetical protein MASR2M70_08540 [Bacillota bacterium]